MRWLIITFSVGGGFANELLVFKHGVKISCTDVITPAVNSHRGHRVDFRSRGANRQPTQSHCCRGLKICRLYLETSYHHVSMISMFQCRCFVTIAKQLQNTMI